jgi:hypothetical protein
MSYLKNNFNGGQTKTKTSFAVKKIGFTIIANFIAHDSSLLSYSTKDNDDLWKGCVVELFLDLGDRDFYYEFEVAPNGATFVAKKYIDHLDFIKNDFFKSKSVIDGTSYKVEMVIDLSKLNILKDIRYNAFRIENDSPKEKSDNLFALNPTLCDTFHIREKFIKL